MATRGRKQAAESSATAAATVETQIANSAAELTGDMAGRALTADSASLLNAVAQATNQGSSLLVSREHFAQLEMLGYITLSDDPSNPANPDSKTVTLSESGRQFLMNPTDQTAPVADTAPVAAEAVAASTPAAKRAISKPSPYTLAVGVPMPAMKTRGRNAAYPFATMEVGQAFFIEADAGRKDQLKSINGTVSVQNKREENVAAGKKFQAAEVEGDNFGKPGVKGYGVWRTA